MESKEKLFNVEIFKLIFRKVGWIGVLYQILLLGIVAFPLFLQAMDYKNIPDYQGQYQLSLFDVASEVQLIVFIFVPLILGLFLYRFLMKKNSAVFMHSLPISRKSIYLHHTVSGIVLLIVPILITMIASFIIVEASVMPEEIKSLFVYLDWILIAGSVTMFLFSVSTMIAMITGNFKMQGALTIGVIAVPFVFVLGLNTFFFRLFYGYYFTMPSIDGSFQDSIYQLSAILFIISLIIFVISYLIYLKRDIENSSYSIVFKPLRPVFKYGLTIMFLLSTSLVMAGFVTSTFAYFVALVIGSIIGYFIAVLVLKGLKITLKDLIGLLVFLGIFGVSFVGMVYYSEIYEAKIPDVSEISNVAISTGEYSVNYYDYTDYNEFKEEVEAVGILTDTESFEVVTEVHQEFIDANPEAYNPSDIYTRSFTITYTLKDGSEISRAYDMMAEDAPEIEEEILAMPELVQNYCEFLDSMASEASWVFAYGKKNIDMSAFIEGDLISGFIDALIADIEEVGLVGYQYSETSPQEGIGYEIEFKEGTVQVFSVINEDYVNTIKWLEDNADAITN